MRKLEFLTQDNWSVVYADLVSIIFLALAVYNLPPAKTL
jgi:hypothetical protein